MSYDIFTSPSKPSKKKKQNNCWRLAVKEKLANSAIYMLIGSIYVYSICSSIISGTVLEVSQKNLFLMGFSILLVLMIIFYNKYSMYISTAILVLFGTYIYYELQSPKEGFIYEVARLIYDTVLFIRGYLPYDRQYVSIVIIAICFLVSLITVMVLYVSFNFYLLLTFGIIVFSASWILKYYSNDTPFLLFLFCIVVLFVKKMDLLSKLNSGQNGNGAFTFSIIPICTIVLLIATLLPKPGVKFEKQKISKFFENPIESTRDYLYFAFNPKYFSFQSTGFSQRNNKLGGKVALNDREVMKVYSNDDEKIYLAGAYKDIYTGDSWLVSDEQFVKYSHEMQMHEVNEFFSNSITYPHFLSGVLSHASLTEQRMGRIFRRNLTIDIGKARTGTIFTVGKNTGLEIEQSVEVLMNGNGALRAKEILPANSTYSYNYLKLNYERIYSLNSRRGYYKEISSFLSGFLLGNNLILDEMSYFPNTLAPYADAVYEKYTALPQTVPERVYELAESISQKPSLGSLVSSTYEPKPLTDFEKAKNIQEYLLETYKYTLEPENIPLDSDFVDYFLFEGKEGYCTYFASAMAVLTRCIGLPSRYVEGFVTPDQKIDGAYNVTNLNAHAWAEVYFEGFGWFPFEATASYASSFYDNQPPNSDIFNDDQMTNSPYYERYLQDLGVDLPSLPLDDVLQTEKLNITNISYSNMLISAMCFVFAVFLLYAAYRILKIKLYYNKIRKLPLNESVVHYFNLTVKLLKFLGYEILNTDTPESFSMRYRQNDYSVPLDLAASIYYKAVYSKKDISKDEHSNVKNCYLQLLSKLGNKKRVLWFFKE